jgi:threonine dehydrogenase-like Zn-dependent dehydrogenase
MKAQVVEAPHRMAFKEVPVPQISDDEVLVKVKYCGVCGSDWSIYTGKYAADKLPLITGHEFWGTVEKTGKKASSLKVGDRVAVDLCITCGVCYFCRRGDGLLCEEFTQLGIHTDGGFAEYVKVPWKNCYPIPDEVDDISATFIEPLTAVIQASRRMACELGASVAVLGCGLGILHAAFAKLRGAAPVMIIGSNSERLEIAKKMGAADYFIDLKKVPDPVEEVKKLTGGIGADYVIEAVGTAKTYEQAFAMLRRGGRLEAFGICAQDDNASLSPYEFVLGEKKVSGSCAGIGNDWGVAINLLKYGRVNPTPMCSMIVPLGELEDALKELRENKKLMKVLVDPQASKRVTL